MSECRWRSEGARGIDALDDVAVYYAPAGDSLTLTLDESLLTRALDRASRRIDGTPAGDEVSLAQPTADWAGQNVALRVDRQVIDAVTKISGESYHDVMQARCWSNLPILNEWKRWYPDQDPVALHRRLWHVALVCPGGGEYVWNDDWQSMESTVYGHPGQPKRGPSTPPLVGRLSSAAFGVTFENQGLRATSAVRPRVNARNGLTIGRVSPDQRLNVKQRSWPTNRTNSLTNGWMKSLPTT